MKAETRERIKENKNKEFVEHPKPLSKKEWEFWEDRLGFFIQEFEDNIAHIARDNIKDGESYEYDHFLAGMAQGMWAVYSFVEDRMVKDETDENHDFKINKSNKKKKTLKLRTISEDHKQKIKKGIRKYWRKIKSNRKKFGSAVIHKTIEKETRGRIARTISSKDVLDVFKHFNKGKRLNTKEIFSELVKARNVSRNYGLARNKKALADRVYILTRIGKLNMKKKGKKNYYRIV